MKALYTTQGGGVCEYILGTAVAVWVEPPEDFPHMLPGEAVPDEWSTAPLNREAIEEMDQMAEQAERQSFEW